MPAPPGLGRRGGAAKGQGWGAWTDVKLGCRRTPEERPRAPPGHRSQCSSLPGLLRNVIEDAGPEAAQRGGPRLFPVPLPGDLRAPALPLPAQHA